MRWVKKYNRSGDERIVKRFALFPISICTGYIKEIHWLETVYIKQTFNEYYNVWRYEDFVTRDEYLEFKNRE